MPGRHPWRYPEAWQCVRAPGQRGVGGRVQVLPAQQSWHTVGIVLVPLAPHVQQLLVLEGAHLHDLPVHREGRCLGGRKGTGMHSGSLGVSVRGLPCRGFTWGRGTPQSHFPSCHQKRRSCCEVGPFETGPGEENKRRIQLTCFNRGKMEGNTPDQTVHKQCGRRLPRRG